MQIPTDCNEGKYFVNSEFCDRCNIYFDDWYTETIGKTQKGATAFLLSVLKSILDEQIEAKQLSNAAGTCIYEAVRDQAYRQGWITGYE